MVVGLTLLQLHTGLTLGTEDPDSSCIGGGHIGYIQTIAH